MENQIKKAHLRVFANTFGSGSSKVLNQSVDEQLAFFNAQQSKVRLWLRNINKKLDELNAQKIIAGMTPEERAALLKRKAPKQKTIQE